MNVTERLCELIVSIGFDDLPAAVVDQARRLVLDGIAVALAGTVREQAPGILAAHVRELGGQGAATIMGFGFKAPPTSAAYVNGASMHVLDFEPMWSPPNHQLSITLPVALALAEAKRLPGREVMASMVKGIEIAGWVLEASGLYDPKLLRHHPPGLVGPLAAAVVASHLLHLDAGQLRNALGIAASRAGSVLANIGTMTKSLHCGLAASLGLDAALLAARGMTGNVDVFETPRGYMETFFDEFELSDLLRFGPPFRVIQPGFAIKMYPSQFATHFVITAALNLRRRIADPQRIEAVRLTTPVMPYIDRPCPATGLEGKFSWQFTTACALLDGEVTLTSFTDSRRFRPDMERLLGRIVLDMRDDIPGRLDRMHVEVAVTLTGGEVLSAGCDGPPGAWGAPPIPEADHRRKVRDCLATCLETAEVKQVIDLAGETDELESTGIGELMGILANPRTYDTRH